jgi:AraC-like DNA-binding protein/mannose-6-phosphate isomerase-like protein (cupin superfamily)
VFKGGEIMKAEETTPVRYVQPDDWDGSDRRVNGDQETVNYLGNSHIRLWYNNQTEGYPTHHHGAVEIIACLKGDYTISCQNQVYHLKEKDLLFIPPHMLHRLMGSTSGARLIMLFDNTPVTAFADYKLISARFIRPLYFSTSKDPVLHNEIWEDMNRITDIYFRHESMWELNVYARILHIFASFGRQTLSQSNPFPDQGTAAVQKGYDHFTKLLTYLENNVQHCLSLEEAAEFTGYSKFHFSRLFKEYIGSTYYEYIQSLRIRTAKELLATDISVTEVAYQTGFNDLASFSRAFKNNTGITPTKYRSLTIRER